MRKLSIFMLLLLLIFLFLQRDIQGILYSNLGWLVWSRYDVEYNDRVKLAAPLFKRALSLDPLNSQARTGLALANTSIGNEQEAFRNWDIIAIDPSIPIAYGDKRKVLGDINSALILYRNAFKLGKSGSAEGNILAGNICQRAFSNPELLTAENREYCRTYFLNKEGNLAINGDFSNGTLSGWSRRYWSGFSGDYLIEQVDGNESSVAVILGEEDGEVGSLSQSLTFDAGTEVRFSAKIKVEVQEDASVRFLHVVWTNPDNSSSGNQLTTILDSVDWQYFEGMIRLPEAEGETYTFSPALLTGKGKVWIDDVRLEILSVD